MSQLTHTDHTYRAVMTYRPVVTYRCMTYRCMTYRCMTYRPVRHITLTELSHTDHTYRAVMHRSHLQSCHAPVVMYSHSTQL